MDINKVMLIGRLTRDPEERRLPTGQKVASFSVATGYTWRDMKTKEKKETAEYHSTVAWGKLADIVMQYLKKGSRVYLEGRLSSRSWRDKQGNPRKITNIVADELVMLGHSGKSKASDAFVKEVPANVMVEEE